MQELPIGISDYRTLIEYKNPLTKQGYLYVDKSLFIKEIIVNSGTKVIVLTRPRRFGKTLNLSMLQYFYAAEVDGKPTAQLFAGSAIAKYPDCMQLQGKYPVIFLGLKDTKAATYDSAINKLYKQIRELYSQHRYVLEGNHLAAEEKAAFLNILHNKASIDALTFALSDLTKYLHKVFGQQVYLLIDEYDTPIQESYIQGYSKPFISFLRNFWDSSLENNYVKQSILTGILRIKESLVADSSNMEFYTILDDKYASCFGFTENEVTTLLATAGFSIHEAKEWYHGYSFGNAIMYNPLAIVKFIKEHGTPGPYWVTTSSNELIKQLIINAAPAIKDKIAKLIAGETITEPLEDALDTNPTSIWNLFATSGYLTVSATPGPYGVTGKLAIPNKEIEMLYKRIVREWLTGSLGLTWYKEFLANVTTGNVTAFEAKLQTLLMEVPHMDIYHDLKLGLVAGLKDTHKITSKQEAGRYEIVIIPKAPKMLGIVMAFIATDDDLEQVAQIALESINVTALKQCGITNICKMGLAFTKASCNSWLKVKFNLV